MSRSDYDDNCGGRELALWRGAVDRAIRGRRGQRLLCDLAAALDAMPVRALIDDALESDGDVCALGALGRARGMALGALDPHDPVRVAAAFDVAPALVREITYINDEASWRTETPEQRWIRVRRWVAEQLGEEPT